MKFGLTSSEYKFICDEVVAPLIGAGAQVWCFGSRARGDHKKFSDLDLMVDSSSDLSTLIADLSEMLTESNFPYKVDLVAKKNFASSYLANFETEKTKIILE